MSEPSPNGQANGQHGNGLFAMVPLAIAARKDLSPGGKLLFGIIYSLEHAALARCVASNQELSNRIGEPIYQVNRLLQELEDRQLIARDLAHGRRQAIRVTWKPSISRISKRRIAPALCSIAPARACIAPALTEKTFEKTFEKRTTTTTPCGSAKRSPGSNGNLETSSSSFAALHESGGTGGRRPPRRSGPPRDGKPGAAAIDPQRLTAAVAALLALGLRRYEGDAAPLDAAQAEKLIQGAARKWSGGLRWIMWAIHHAAKRRNPAKGKKAVQVWGWIVGTLQRWEQEESGPPESDGWPGERTAVPRKIAEPIPYNPWA